MYFFFGFFLGLAFLTAPAAQTWPNHWPLIIIGLSIIVGFMFYLIEKIK